MNNRESKWPQQMAGVVIVIAGSVSFVYSVVKGAYDTATASAAFTVLGLYLLGVKPPRKIL